MKTKKIKPTPEAEVKDMISYWLQGQLSAISGQIGKTLVTCQMQGRVESAAALQEAVYALNRAENAIGKKI